MAWKERVCIDTGNHIPNRAQELLECVPERRT